LRDDLITRLQQLISKHEREETQPERKQKNKTKNI
jgi:hypothetical protein